MKEIVLKQVKIVQEQLSNFLQKNNVKVAPAIINENGIQIRF